MCFVCVCLVVEVFCQERARVVLHALVSFLFNFSFSSPPSFFLLSSQIDSFTHIVVYYTREAAAAFAFPPSQQTNLLKIIAFLKQERHIMPRVTFAAAGRSALRGACARGCKERGIGTRASDGGGVLRLVLVVLAFIVAVVS